MKKIFVLAIVAIFLLFQGKAQISVTGGLTGQQLAEILAGQNITVTNAVLTGGSVASGSFTGTNSDIGFNSGVILSTGNINSSPGPNNTGNSGQNLSQPGTPQMTSLAGANTFDAITLEFDFEVQSSSIQFNYVFASEEYPEYAPPNNSLYNDVFAFYISGPGITGEENIALVPNSTDPVAINNINPAINSQYYVDNTGGQDIQFDGFTTILQAKRSNLTPCQIYHLKLVISDAGDAVYNSAVFLQENSLVQGLIGVQTQTINSDDIALEGCIKASFTFSYDEVSNQDRIIDFIVGGTAVNGVDYQFIDNSMTIVAGDTSATIFIDAFSDGLTEGQESIWIIYQPANCADYDTAFLYINDAQPIDFSLNGTNLDCYNDNTGEILVNATGGFPQYTYHVTYPDNQLVQTQSNPITGLSAGTYSVQVYDRYGCKADALVIGGVYDADTTFLPDGSGVTYEAPLVIAGFNPGQIITDVSQIQQICLTMEHSYLGDLQLRVQSPSGQSVILKQQNGGGSCDLGEPIATAAVDGQASSSLTDPGSGYEYCFNANPVYNTMVNESGNFTRNYTDAQGHSYTDNYLPAGSYTPYQPFSNLVGSTMNGTWKVFVTDQWALDNGYIFNWYISLIGDEPDTLITLTQPAPMSLTGFVTNATCGSSNGAINLSIQGAIAPYSVSWSSGQNTEDLTGVAAGTYIATVTDANGCQLSETFLVNNNGSLAISSSAIPTTCFGGNNGSINITPSGGQIPYTFNWSSGQSTEDISGLAAGTYTVTMQDQNGCIISKTITVGSASQINITTQSIQNEICNTDNGSIDINVSGGSGSYGYQWSSGQTVQDISSLTSGSYTVNVVDGNGCTANRSFSISNDVSNCSAFCYLDVQANNLIQESCGNRNGSIDINVLNGVAPLTYIWNNGASTQDISGLQAGTYTVTVTDANNCTDQASFTINNNVGNLTFSNLTISDENCSNSNGSINLSVSGGAMPYTYQWSNGAQTEDISGLSADTYVLTVRDGNGCQKTGSYIIQNNPGNLIVTATVTPEACTSSNGSINQSVSGANGTLSYSWSSGQSTQDIFGASSGQYTCITTDQNGCSVTKVYTIGRQSGDISLVGSNITHELCGNGLGAVNITLTGNNLSYLWSNGATSEDLSGVSAGNYSCVISNAQGCTLSTPVFSVINSAGNLNVSVQLISNEICGAANGAVNMNVSGGNAPYQYLWSNGSTDEDLSGISAGVYTLTVTDVNGCSESRSVTVGSSSGTLSIQNAIITHESCGNGAGAIDVIPTGGTGPLTYAWQHGPVTQDLSALNAGSYEITISDQNGCLTSGFYIVNNQANNLSYTQSVTNEICSNGQGQISLNVSGGTGPYNYNWSNSGVSASINGLSNGDYSCVITDDLGCMIQTGNISIGNTPAGISATTTVMHASCSNNGQINLTVTGGAAPLNFLWSNNATTEDISGLSAGLYNYTINDANGCSLSGSATVNQLNGNLSHSFTTSSAVCGNSNGAINLTPSGGQGPYLFLWDNGATSEDLSGIAAGSYVCTITDQNNCSLTTAPIQVTNNGGSLNISNIVTTNETCANGLGSIDISIAGGQNPINYIWSNSATTQDVNNLSSGIYSVVVSDGNGCQTSAQVVVNSSSGSLAITQPILTNEVCMNGQGSIDISVVGAANPINYLWSTGSTTQDLTGLSAGNYTVSVSDGNGCFVSRTFTISNTGSSLAISNATINNESCGSGTGSISLTVSGGSAPYSYNWSNGATTSTINNLSAGSYQVNVTGASGCQVSGVYTIQNNAGNLALAGVITNENCGDGSGAINITTSGGNQPISYSWNNNSTSEDLSGLASGVYSLNVTDNFGCTVSYTGTVNNITNGLDVTIDVTTDENCGQNDGAMDASISGSGIASISWSSGQSTEDITGISAGNYTISVTNAVGCTAYAIASIGNQTGSMALSFSSVGNENCMNGQGYIDIEVNGTGPFNYNWSDGQTTQDAVGLSAGSYNVTITDGFGCELNQTFTVTNINATNLNVSESITRPFCTSSNGAIDVTVNGGISPYSYAWNSGQTVQDLNNIQSGTYILTVTDGANCQVSKIIPVNPQNSNLGFTQLQIQNEFCGQDDGSIIIWTGGTASNYYINGVNNGGPNIFNLSAGTYTLSISDNFGCWVDTVATVGSNAFFNASHTLIHESCSDSNGAIDITVSGGGGGTYSYLWSNGATTQDLLNVPAGTYTVTITRNGGGGGPCSLDYTVTLNNNTNFAISAQVTDDYCLLSQGSINQTLTSGSGVNYSWSNGSSNQDIVALSPGDYTCIVSFVGGCTESYNYTVGNTANGMIANVIETSENCSSSDGTIEVNVSGGSGSFSYIWDIGSTSNLITGIGAGTYEVTITDITDNCMIVETSQISNLNTVFGANGVISNAPCATCTDGSIDVSIANSSSYTFSWDNGESTEDINNLVPGIYTLTISSVQGCDTTLTFEVLNTIGLNEIEMSGLFMEIHPNPAIDNFLVKYTLPEDIAAQLIITDALGKKVKEFEIQGSNEMQFDCANFNSGMYFVTLKSESQIFIERVIINNK